MPVCGSKMAFCVSIFAEDVMPAKGTLISTLDGPDRMTHLGGFILVISHLLLYSRFHVYGSRGLRNIK
jgi:hypothetical protein